MLCSVIFMVLLHYNHAFSHNTCPCITPTNQHQTFTGELEEKEEEKKEEEEVSWWQFASGLTVQELAAAGILHEIGTN